MIIEPSNYTYETMPDYTDAVDGAVEIPVTGEEMEIRYAHEVVYDEAHNLHLEIFTPFQMAHPERTWPCITFIQGSAWMKQYVYQKVGMIARLAQRGYVVAIVEYRHSGIAHFPAQIIDAKKCGTFSACACGGIQAESIADAPDGRFFRRTGFFRCRHDRKERKT